MKLEMIKAHFEAKKKSKAKIYVNIYTTKLAQSEGHYAKQRKQILNAFHYDSTDEITWCVVYMLLEGGHRRGLSGGGRCEKRWQVPMGRGRERSRTSALYLDWILNYTEFVSVLRNVCQSSKWLYKVLFKFGWSHLLLFCTPQLSNPPAVPWLTWGTLS